MKPAAVPDLTGITAIADALRISSSLQRANLRNNGLGTEGWCTIFDALRDKSQNKITRWNLSDEKIDAKIAKSIAAYITKSDSLTQVFHSVCRRSRRPWLPSACLGRSCMCKWASHPVLPFA